MSTDELDGTTPATVPSFDTRWPLGAAVGFLAGLARPVAVTVLSAVDLPVGPFALTLQPELPLWGLVHLTYSLAFGALYAAVAYRGRARAHVDRATTGALVGAGYGVALWFVNVVVFWGLLRRFLLPAGGAGGSLVGPLAGHVVYGVALGILYPVGRRYA